MWKWYGWGAARAYDLPEPPPAALAMPAADGPKKPKDDGDKGKDKDKGKEADGDEMILPPPTGPAETAEAVRPAATLGDARPSDAPADGPVVRGQKPEADPLAALQDRMGRACGAGTVVEDVR